MNIERKELLLLTERILKDLHKTYAINDLDTEQKYVFVSNNEFTTMFVHRLNAGITDISHKNRVIKNNMQPPKQTKYYVNYKFFTGDEHTGESVRSGTIVEADSDKEAIKKVTKRVVEERNGEITRIYNVQNVSGLYELISESIDYEHNSDDFTSVQKFNITFNIAHYLYGK